MSTEPDHCDDHVVQDILTELACHSTAFKKRSYLIDLYRDSKATGLADTITVNKTLAYGAFIQMFDQGRTPLVEINDMSTSNSMNAGGNISAVAQGEGASLTARDITTYNQAVDTAEAPNDLKGALKAARLALEIWQPSDLSERDAVVASFDLFSNQALNPKPNKTTLQILWTGLSATAKTIAGLTGFVKAGEAVMSLLQHVTSK